MIDDDASSCANDPDGSYTCFARSILEDIKRCKDFQQLSGVLIELVGPRDEAVAEGDRLRAAICSCFLDCALFVLLDQLPHPSLQGTVAKIASWAQESLESWCLDLGEVSTSHEDWASLGMVRVSEDDRARGH